MSHIYSRFDKIETQTDSLVSAFVLYFRHGLLGERYTAHIRLVLDTDLMEFEIQMTDIPVSPLRHEAGKEVVAKWRVLDMDNDGVFYTDSNGLEMQERIVGYRPTWNLTTNMTVSSNYYPINSAIAIRDKKSPVQMTVMNDRSQGGASLQAGTIELMQNRRLLFDDRRGVNEPLNEVTWEDKGIAVNAKYYVQIFDYTKTKSLQRHM